MNTTCYIIDHHPLSINMFIERIQSSPGLELIGSETDLSAGLKEIIECRIKPDITLLAVSYSMMPGDLFADAIRPFTEVIFTTAYSGIAEFEKSGVLYIATPVSPENFKKVINLAKQRIVNKRSQRPSSKKAPLRCFF
ncbi:hypothetical protein [Mucilaginibacter sp.]